jgi:hypothetical protein
MQAKPLQEIIVVSQKSYEQIRGKTLGLKAC